MDFQKRDDCEKWFERLAQREWDEELKEFREENLEVRNSSFPLVESPPPGTWIISFQRKRAPKPRSKENQTADAMIALSNIFPPLIIFAVFHKDPYGRYSFLRPFQGKNLYRTIFVILVIALFIMAIPLIQWTEERIIASAVGFFCLTMLLALGQKIKQVSEKQLNMNGYEVFCKQNLLLPLEEILKQTNYRLDDLEEDIKVNQARLLKTTNEQKRVGIEKEIERQKEARSKDVAICGKAYNIQSNLEQKLKQMRDLEKQFADDRSTYFGIYSKSEDIDKSIQDLETFLHSVHERC